MIIFCCSCFMIPPLKDSSVCRYSLEVILSHPPYKTRLIPIITVEDNAYILKNRLCGILTYMFLY